MDGTEKSNGEDKELDGRSEEMLKTFVSLYQRAPKLVRTIARLAADETVLARALSAVSVEPKPREKSPAASVSDDDWKEFRREAVASPQLRELFASDGDRLSASDAQKVSTLAQLADLTPDGPEVLNSQDGPFMGVLAAVLERKIMKAGDAWQLMVADLAKFLTLHTLNPQLASELNELARKPYWHIVLASLEEGADYTVNLEGETESVREEARQALEAVRKKAQGPGYKLDAQFRLSRVPRKLFRMAWDSRQVFDEVLKKMAVESVLAQPIAPPPQQLTPEQKDKVAEEALKSLRAGAATKAEVERIEAGLKLRFLVAQHYLSLREFAKLDAFVYRWGDAARIATSGHDGYEALIKAETRWVNPSATPPPMTTSEEKRLDEICSRDELLQRFLRLRPYFSEIDQRKLLQRRPALAFEAFEPPQPTTTTTPPTTGTTTGEQAERTPTPTPAGTLDITLSISRRDTKVESFKEIPLYRVAYQVSANMPGRQPIEGEYSPRAPEHADNLLEPFGLKAGASSISLSESLSQRTDMTYQIARAGQALFNDVLGPLADQEGFADFAKELQGTRETRLSVNTEVPEIASLPWEWLALSGQKESLALLPNFSLVRYIPTKPSQPPTPRTDLFPLRVLMVHSHQNEKAQREASARIRSLQSVLSRSDGAHFRLPSGMTPEELGQQMKDFRPHVLHFEAVVDYLPTRGPEEPTLGPGEPALYLAEREGEKGFMRLSDLKSLLLDAGVQLAVFGNNVRTDSADAPVFHENPLLEFIVGLLSEGLPSALVPTRRVELNSATEFLSAFYRSWLSGVSIEQAVYTARSERRTRGGDWSAFALFGDAPAVEGLRVPRPAS